MSKAKKTAAARFVGFSKKAFNPQKPKKAAVGLRSLSDWIALLFKKKRTATVKSSLKDFTSGGQLTMHSVRMFGQAARSVFWIVVILFILLWGMCFFLNTKAFDRYLVFESLDAYRKGILRGKRATHWLLDENQQPIEVVARDLIKHPRTRISLEACFKSFKVGALQALFLSLIPFIVLTRYFCLRGTQGRSPTDFTGQMRVRAEDLSKSLRKANKASSFELSGLPLLKGAEVQHLLLTGTTGTGKTLCLEELMDQIRAKKQRAIVYDIEGTFVSHYYRKGQDILLNPLDKRCPAWNVWQEGNKASDFEAMAVSMMPLHLAGTDPFWIHSARTIFACAAQGLELKNQRSMKELLVPLFSESLGSLSRLVSGSVAESLVSDKNEKTALSIKATLSTYCKALRYLQDEGGPLFSISDWLKCDAQDSWLFIATDAQSVEALKPLISVWLDVAAKSVLSLAPSDTRRLWFILDELPSLHRLPNLINTLARGRKYGGCFVAAIQDIHQIRGLYGHNEAETFLSLFNTNLCYRTKCPQTASWMSKIMGGLEYMEKKEAYSYGAHETRDSVSVQPERRREAVIKETEFLELNDCEAFLKLPGHWPVTSLRFTPKEREKLSEPLLEKDLRALLVFDLKETKKNSDKPATATESANTVEPEEGPPSQESLPPTQTAVVQASKKTLRYELEGMPKDIQSLEKG